MEYVEGRTLGQLLRERGPLSAAAACAYARQAAAALQHAHEHGLTHRDVKPDNLMLTLPPGAATDALGVVKVLDFGLASLAEIQGGGPLTAPDASLGTPDYMAPEQILDAHSADARADVYSLGCSLYQLLAGRTPFTGAGPVDKMLAHLEQTPTPLGQLRPDLPAGLEAVVARMMARKASDRFQTAAEVADALAAFAGAADEPRAGPAPPPPSAPAQPSPASRPRRRARRNWRTMALRTLTLLALAAIAAGVIVVLRTQKEEEVTVETDDPNLALVVRRGDEVVRIVDPVSKRTWGLDAGKYHLRSADEPYGLRIDLPDPESFTFRRGDKGVLRVGRNVRPNPGEVEDEVRMFKGHEGGVTCVAWSTKDRRVFTGGNDGTIRVWDAETGVEQHRFPGHNGGVLSLAVSPDGRRLLSGGRDSALRVWDVSTGEEVHSLPGATDPSWSVAFLGDSRRAWCSSEDKGAQLYDVVTGKVLCRLQGSWVNAVAAGADGDVVLTGGGQGRFLLWSPKEPLEPQWSPPGHRKWVRAVAITPDGRFGVSCSGESFPKSKGVGTSKNDSTVRVWDLTERRERACFSGHENTVLSVAIAPDGRRVLSGGGDGTVRLWDVAGGREIARFGARAVVRSVALSPDGRYALSGGGDSAARLWRLPDPSDR
jgi:WD40 repeat protein